MNLIEKFKKAYQATLLADALSMPVHWYYNRKKIDTDYGAIDTFHTPKAFHPDSIFWRSSYEIINQKADILHAHKSHWGTPNVHYHLGLKAGENTLNFKLAKALYKQVQNNKNYDPETWLKLYVELMLDPTFQTDPYVEEYHRGFFSRYASGKKLLKCGIKDEHIGGLAQVPALLAASVSTGVHDREKLREIVKQHVALTHRHSNVLRAADCLTRLLWAVAHDIDPHEAIKKEAGDWFSSKKATPWLNMDDRTIIGNRYSPACYIDQAFPASIYLVFKYKNDLKSGIQANAEVGGDNCHRAAVVAALLAIQSNQNLENLFPMPKTSIQNP